MPATWPSDLPQDFGVDGMSEQMGDGRAAGGGDVGPPKFWNRSSAVVDSMAGSMVMSSDQWLSLKTFVRSTLAGGSLPFSFPAQEEGGEDMLVVFAADGLPRREALASGLWQVSFGLSILP